MECKSAGTCLVGDVGKAREVILKGLTIHLTSLHTCRALTILVCPYSKTSSGSVQYVAVRFSCSVVSDSVTPWTAAHQASLSVTNSQSLFKLMSIKLVMPSNLLILCHPLFLPPSIFPSIGVFSHESALCIRCFSLLICETWLRINPPHGVIVRT